jgi:hypothetical protein
MKKDKKKLIVNDLNRINESFFKNYNIDYWLYKICVLKECHNNSNKVFDIITKDLIDADIEDFRKTLRLELHFLYFHLIETFFTLYFTVCKHSNTQLWLALAFSKDQDTFFYLDIYKMIKDFKEGKLLDFDPEKVIQVNFDGKVDKITLLKFALYFLYPINLSEAEWIKNTDNIKKMLFMFAKDFSDRGEYNAYKHSLRMYPSSFELSFDKKILGQSEDSINFLERQIIKKESENKRTERVVITTKPFNFERDYKCCIFITQLIQNIINSRKYVYLKELHKKKFNLFFFHKDFNCREYLWKTGIIRSSFTI